MKFERRPNESHREILRDNARGLREHQTLAERLLWSRIRGNKLGVRFRRQHRIGNIIVDFYCAETSLVIELDGRSHEFDEQLDKDEQRDEYLISRGLRVQRFSNQQVYRNLDGTVRTIARLCALDLDNLPPSIRRRPSPLPPSQSTGRGSENSPPSRSTERGSVA